MRLTRATSTSIADRISLFYVGGSFAIYVMEIYPAKEMMTVASAFARRSRAARGARERTGTAQAAPIELRGVTKRFATPSGSMFTAVRGFDMTVGAGKFCAVVGPSGCGKTTSLTMVAGLERPSAGTVSVGGKPVDGITAGTSFMFQADALMPW